MGFDTFHFSQPLGLLGLLLIPLTWFIYFLFYRAENRSPSLQKWIDPHLLPYLLVGYQEKKNILWKQLLLWSIAWSCLVMGFAGPRWSFREVETFSKDKSLVILLDLSESMNTTDVKPSRLAKAKQKVEDLLNSAQGAKIGLIAFAADPHLIAPLTDDKETIRYLLSTLTTELMYVQGSRLSSALEMAGSLFAMESGQNNTIVLLSDGGFEDPSALSKARALSDKGILIHAIGIGTSLGAPLQDHHGTLLKKEGTPVISKLEEEKLRQISQSGKGHYFDFQNGLETEALILKNLQNEADTKTLKGTKNRLWDEGFAWFLLPVIPILLWWFRKGTLFCLIMVFSIQTIEGKDYFKTRDQEGKEAYEKEDYSAAIESFQDDYRKGVACYRAGRFSEAEELFRRSQREEVDRSSKYNLGNTLVQQQKYKEAIKAYEEVLKQWPDHKNTKENLELVKKLLEEQDQQQQKSENQKEPQPENQQEQNENQQESSQQDSSQQDSSEQDEGQQDKNQAQERDREADLWLNQIENDPTQFMKNKCYIESKKKGTKECIDPW